MESEDNIVQFPLRSSEVINGVSVDLARLGLRELWQTELECTKRFLQAHRELGVVRRHLDDRMVDGGGAS